MNRPPSPLTMLLSRHTNRREFILLLGGVGAAWPLAARAQQQAMPVVGFLNSTSPAPWAHLVVAFRRGLGETGYVENRNVAIEYRWAEGHLDRLPALAADLVRRQVAVIVATGGTASGLAVKAATSTIPVVFTSSGDPVKEGLVASLNRPGGNATGLVVLLTAMEGKRLGLLREMVPTTTPIAVLLNPDVPTFETQLNDVREAARAVGQQIHVLHASSEREIDVAFTKMVEVRAGALLVAADPMLFSQRERRYATPFRRSMNCASMRRSAA